ncbi:6-pyruvoyltetrahydropterin/6-carboxytetrahydropterin synthase [Lachnospiraceae bacterium C7]|nr:6-pyruvoyltetrahydropterin/6-carboxytetrahydropterin synthase [Lachnospiraceae bacterium C7]
MYTVRTESSFDAAHFLARYNGKCRNLHGHRWRVQVEVKGTELKDGMVVDFTDIKKELKELCDNLDHSLIIEENSLKESTLNALRDEDFKINIVDFRPTAENFSKYFYDKLKVNNDVSKVSVYETPNNCATYEE